MRTGCWLALGLLCTMPLLSLWTAWWPWGEAGAQATQILHEMAATVLPGYLQTTAALVLLVGLGVLLVGLASALAVSLFEFPGRKLFQWALLLPLAMPAYVVAYAYTDFLQYSGPLQSLLRDTLGLQGRVFPQVRSLAGAAWVFTFTLYPYVYLLARTALSERATHLMEAARLLGAALPRRLLQVALPLARPAVAAGVALALMETLADFGVSSYFGIQTFTAGIYKAWLAMDNRIAAAQLASMLLGAVGLLLFLERRAQARRRFAARGPQVSGSPEARALVLRGAPRVLAWLVCATPVLMGFVLPVFFMLRPLWLETGALPWAQFMTWTAHSVALAAVTAACAVALSWALAFALRRAPDLAVRSVAYVVGLGYAVPGAVLVVGLLLPVGWIQAAWPDSGLGSWLTATSLGLVWAYLVRFTGVALQTMQSGYTRIPVSLDDASQLLGVRAWGLLRRVHMPLLGQSTAAAALLVFVDVMKELPATLVLRPFNSDTLAVVAYQLARDERLGEAALPCLTLALVGLVPVLLLSRTLRTQDRSADRRA